MDGNLANKEAEKLEGVAADNPGVRCQSLRLGWWPDAFSHQLRVHP